MLHFLFPPALFALGGALAFFFLYRHRLHSKEILVGSLELWLKSQKKKGMSQKTRKFSFPWWLLLLNVFVYSLFVFSIAGPFVVLRVKRIVLLLDRSASMKTQGEGGTVFEKSLSRIDDFLSRHAPKEIVLATFPPYEVHTGGIGDIASLLERIQPSRRGASFEEIFKGLSSSYQEPIFFFTDGAGRARGTFPGVISRCSGISRSDNVGIVHCETSAVTPRKHQLYAIVRNFSTVPSSVRIRLSSDGKTVAQESILLKERQRYGWSYRGELGEELELSLDPLDRFPLDNVVKASKKKPLRVSLPKNPSLSIKTVCRAIPGIEISNKAEADFHFSTEWGAYPGEAILLYRGPSPSLPAQGKTVYAPAVTVSADPILWGVHPESIALRRCVPLAEPLPKDAVPLLETEKGPIMAYGKNWLYVGFSSARSDWEKSPSFPIFWKNVFDHFDPGRTLFAFGENEGVNLLDEKESDNVGEENEWEKEGTYDTSTSFDLTPYSIGATFLALLLLWYAERSFPGRFPGLVY